MASQQKKNKYVSWAAEYAASPTRLTFWALLSCSVLIAILAYVFINSVLRLDRLTHPKAIESDSECFESDAVRVETVGDEVRLYLVPESGGGVDFGSRQEPKNDALPYLTLKSSQVHDGRVLSAVFHRVDQAAPTQRLYMAELSSLGFLAPGSYHLGRTVSTNTLPGIVEETLKRYNQLSSSPTISYDSQQRRRIGEATFCLFDAGLVGTDSLRGLVGRVVNGPVQFWTVVSFVLLLVILWGRYYLREGGAESRSPRVRLTDNVHRWRDGGSPPEQLPGLIDVESKVIHKRVDSSYHLPQALLAIIPLIGFIGTILGISGAMGQAEMIGSSDRVVQMLARGSVTGEIAVAFDTTLLALVLNLIGLLIYVGVKGTEEQVLNDAAEAAIEVAAEAGESEAVRRAERAYKARRAELEQVKRRLQSQAIDLEAANAEAAVAEQQIALLDEKRRMLELRANHARSRASALRDKQSLGHSLDEVSDELKRIDKELDQLTSGPPDPTLSTSSESVLTGRDENEDGHELS